MKKPQKVSVGRMVFTIYWMPKLNECKGYTETSTNSIFIDESFDLITQQHVLLHEILHAVWYAYHLNPPNHFEYDHEEEGHGMSYVEEYVVSAMSPAVIQVMLDNPEVERFIFHRRSE